MGSPVEAKLPIGRDMTEVAIRFRALSKKAPAVKFGLEVIGR